MVCLQKKEKLPTRNLKNLVFKIPYWVKQNVILLFNTASTNYNKQIVITVKQRLEVNCCRLKTKGVLPASTCRWCCCQHALSATENIEDRLFRRGVTSLFAKWTPGYLQTAARNEQTTACGNGTQWDLLTFYTSLQILRENDDRGWRARLRHWETRSDWKTEWMSVGK